MSSSETWVPAMEAAKQLAAKFGGISRAQQAIATALREGLLSAGAEECAYLDDDGNPVDKEATSGQPIEIPTEDWWRSDNWPADLMRWGWGIGWFEVRGEDAEDDRTYIGVTFRTDELDRLDPSNPVLLEVQATAVVRRGPKAQANKWGALIGAFLELDRQNKLNVTDFEGIGDLLRAVEDAVPPDLMFSDRTIDGVLGYVWEHHLGGRRPPNPRK